MANFLLKIIVWRLETNYFAMLMPICNLLTVMDFRSQEVNQKARTKSKNLLFTLSDF